DVAAEALTELNKAAKETLISIESLMALVEEASRLKEADYTPESWKVFMKELRAAEELLDKSADVNQVISAETLQKAEDALEGAIKQLKLRKADPGKGKDDSGKNSQGGKKDSILPKTGEVSSNVAFIGVAFLSLSGAYIWLRRKDKDVA
ncbi:MAG: LPXTG cell wall anchor domain-containing protein, partial [Vagococcus sp.]